MSRPLETLYAQPRQTQVVKPFDLLLGEKRRVSVDWNAYLAYKDGVTISSSTWTSEGRLVAPGSSLNASGITSTLLTPGTALGVDSIKNQVSLSNGEQLVRKFRVNTIDPLNLFISGGSVGLQAFQIQPDEFNAADYGGTIPIQVDLTESANGELFNVYFDGVLQPIANFIQPNYPSESLRLANDVDRTQFERLTVIYSY